MNKSASVRAKRTQRDYNIGFKLSVISEVEKGDMTYKQAQKRYGIQGRSTVLSWLRKHGNLDWSNPKIHSMSTPRIRETPAQTIKRLEKQLTDEKIKNKILSKMIDISDSQYGTAIRKKYSPKQSGSSEKERK